MGTLLGFIFGYVAGAQAGPQGYQKVRDAWQEIVASEEWKGLVAGGMELLDGVLEQRRAFLRETPAAGRA
jgi:hypothetical protein